MHSWSKTKKQLIILGLIFLISSLGIFVLEIRGVQAEGGIVGRLFDFSFEGIAWIIARIGTIIKFGASLVAYLGAMLLEMAFGIEEFTKAGVVQMGWKIMRDLANMFFVLILLVIAFATILRLETYGMKALLPKLIIAALLINFSLVLAGVVIDFSQVLTHFFYDQVSSQGGVAAQIANVSNFQKAWQLNSQANLPQKLAGGVSGVLMTIFDIFFGTVLILSAGFVLMLGAFFLLVRLVTLWFLLIVAPFAWLLWILPNTANLFRQWWSSFLKWAFFAPIYIFFVYLAIKAGQGGSFADIIQMETENIINASGWRETIGTALAAQPRLLLQFICIMGILFGGLIAAQKMGVYGANGAMGIAKFFGKGAAGLASRNLARVPLPGAGRMAKGISKFGADLAERGYGRLGTRLQTAGELLGESKGKGIFSPGAWKRAWPARRAEVEARAYARPTGALRDQFNYVLSLGKERTRFAEQAEQTEVARRMKEVSDTSRASEFLVDGLEKSMAAGNKIDTSAYLRLIFEGNDQNEVIKQSKILGSEKVLGKDKEGNSLAHVVSDETVTKAVYAALKEAGFAEEQQAKIAMDLGNIAFMSGNYANYGMGIYDMDKKRFRSTDPEEQRIAAAGKADNLESQVKDRNWHWNSIMEEVPKSDEHPDGVRNLHQGGKELLKTITAGDIEQLNRTRPDFQIKIGSERAVSQMRKYADSLEADDPVRAGLIRRFAGQLHVLRTAEKPDWYDEKKYGELRWLPKKEET